MATLSTDGLDSLTLTLRGAAEDRILTTVRRWPHWSQVTVERDPSDGGYSSVTLTTSRLHEQTLRAILHRGFGLDFPPEGGDSTAIAAPPEPERRRRRA